ncbi:PREDICTED: putative protein TPRXL [Nicotiana attenuata]|uniref:putative protein TPRXL n=1 Tax=Nicotiana attenuata TaxID=49451 RepID=UPI000904741F|nr:PREDICTED: putative protein TPRXL [Nicotiana attenuata]
MMSQVKEPSGDNAASSSMEPGTSTTTTEAEEIPERRTQENQLDIPSSSTNEPRMPNWKHKSSHPLDNVQVSTAMSSTFSDSAVTSLHFKSFHLPLKRCISPSTTAISEPSSIRTSPKNLLSISSMADINSEIPTSVISKTNKTKTPKSVDPFSLSSEFPTDQGKSGELGKSPEVAEVSAIIASDSVVAMEPIEEENVATIFAVSVDGVLHAILSQRNEIQGKGEE